MNNASSPSPAKPSETVTRFRSGAVARMVRMPVATLRIWERRYEVSGSARTGAGHRQYTAAEVQRIALLKQLTDLGHSISALARLDIERLREVAATHASALATRAGAPARAAPRALELVVIGEALALRLQRVELTMRLQRPLKIVKTFESLAAVSGRRATVRRADAIVVFTEGLQPDVLDAIHAATAALKLPKAGVLYGYAAERLRSAFLGSGVALLKDDHDDAALAAWLQTLGAAPAHPPLPAPPPGDRLPTVIDGLPELGPLAPRRYNDATLADFAGLSTTIACECPRHVAELVMRLSHFEVYSAECESLGPKDAALHAYLKRVAGAARAMFESALEQVAIHEGLVAP